MDEVSRSLDQLWYKTKDYCDKPQESSVKNLLDVIKRVLNDSRQKKDPDHLMINVKSIKRSLESFKHDDTIYDHHHLDELMDRCDDIERMLRKLA